MNDELLARCRSFIDEQSCGEWDDKAINEDAAKLYEFVQRETASAAQSPEPVAWRWRFEDQSAWTVSKNRPLYADDRDVICEPLYTAPPQSASDGALRESDQAGWLIEKDDPPVYHVVTDDHDAHWTADASKALRFARREDAQAYSDHIGWTSPPVRVVEHMWPASEATKSDGGVEGHAHDPQHGSAFEGGESGRPDKAEAGIKPGPSDTSPADVTVDELTAALDRLVNAKALKGVRSLVAGWNGEDRDEPYKERHPSRLGATLPKTNCGAVYELDEAMQSARKLLDTYKIGAK